MYYQLAAVWFLCGLALYTIMRAILGNDPRGVIVESRAVFIVLFWPFYLLTLIIGSVTGIIDWLVVRKEKVQ